MIPNTIGSLGCVSSSRNLEKLAPRILRSTAAPPWHPAWQAAASKLMLTSPCAGQDKQRARRWPFGA
eukprot:1158105-Pelagomonas_calceolata.AAC.11